MKIKWLTMISVAVLLLSACSATVQQDNHIAATNKQNENSTDINSTMNVINQETQYNIMYADWPVYKNAKELTDAGNVIVLGKITDISFEILDRMTAKTPTDDSESENCYLNTIYSVNVITSYKGDSTDMIMVRLFGGIKGAYIDEQKEALGDRANEGITIMDERPDLEIGQTYLFVLYQYEDTMPTLVNMQQGAFCIDDPLAKDEYSYVSVKDIISSFGEDKWISFESYKNSLD